jgi:hypothetical protein
MALGKPTVPSYDFIIWSLLSRATLNCSFRAKKSRELVVLFISPLLQTVTVLEITLR